MVTGVEKVNGRRQTPLICAIIIYCLVCNTILGTNLIAAATLRETYEFQSSLPVTQSDIGEHLSLLRSLAQECPTVVEIGVRNMVSTVGILQGLSENPSARREYVGIDLNYPPQEVFQEIRRFAKDHGVYFRFFRANDMELDIPLTELLFIDSLHTYCHLTYELEKFCSRVSKYIAMHDTSAPWGEADENVYQGDYSEYPINIDRSKRGLWPAVEDFLNRHPEWILHARHLNCHGFTILKRIQ